jgi:hypothetical protein
MGAASALRVLTPRGLTGSGGARTLGNMLELQCTCDWRCTGETKDDLLRQAKEHLETCEHRGGEPLDEGVLRAMIAQRARPAAQ